MTVPITKSVLIQNVNNTKFLIVLMSNVHLISIVLREYAMIKIHVITFIVITAVLMDNVISPQIHVRN